MARNKFGDDRSKDKSLSTRINGEEMDNLYTEDPVDFDDLLLDDKGDARTPARVTNKWAMEGIHSISKGVLGAIEEELERNMPNVHVVKTEISETLDDIKELKDDISKQLEPVTRQFSQIARRVLPKAQGMMPETWYKKIMEKLEEGAGGTTTGPSKEEQERDIIKSELEGVFGAQAELEKHKELEDTKEKLTDRLLTSTRHKADMRAFTRIYDSVRSTEIFHRTLHTAYMKKSLELKYKHLFVAQDTHNLLSSTLSTFEEYFRGIVKNTSLPDAVKMSMSDYLRKTRTEKYGTLMSDYLSNARKMIFSKVKSSLKEGVEGLGMAVSMADMADPEMLEQMVKEHGGMAGLGIRLGGYLAGRFGGEGPIRGLMDKFSPWMNVVNGSLEGGKDKLYMGLDKLQRKLAQGGAIANFFSQFLPNVSGISAVSNDLLRSGEEPAIFDKLTRASIIEIIPGYLQKILHEAMMIRTGDENAPELKYNIFKRRFTTVGQFQDDAYANPLLFDSKSTQAARLNKAINTIAVGAKEKNPNADAAGGMKHHVKTLSILMANHAVKAWTFNAEAIQKFLENPSPEAVEKSNYLKQISGGIPYKEFVTCLRVIMDGLTDKHGNIDKWQLDQFNVPFINALKTVDTIKQEAPKYREAYGFTEDLSQRDEVTWTDSQGRTHVAIKGQAGLFTDDARLGDEIVRENLSDYDNEDLVKRGDRPNHYEYLKAKKLREDQLAVGTKLSEWKRDVETSAAGQAVSSMWAWMSSFVNGTVADGLKAIDGMPIAGSMKRHLKDKLVESMKAKRADEDEGSPETVRGYSYGSDAENIEVTAPGKRRRKLSEREKRNIRRQEANRNRNRRRQEQAQEEMGKVGTEPEGSPKDEGVVLSVEMGPSKPGLLNRAASWIGGKFKKAYDGLPQSPEEVDAQIKSLEQSMREAYGKRPKDFEEAQAQMMKLMDGLAKENPELAARAKRTYDTVINSRGGKAANAYYQYAKGKMSPYLSKAYSAGKAKYDAIAKAASSKMDEATAKLNAYFAESGSKVDTALIGRVLKGDKEALETFKKEYPDLAKKMEADLSATMEELGKTATTKTMAAAESLGSAYKGAKGFFGRMRDRFNTGAGIEASEGKTEPGIFGDSPKDLMNLLVGWRESTDRAHATIIDAIEHSMYTIAEANKSGGSGKGGQYISIRQFDRNKYGFFGAGGSLIRKTAKGIWNTATWGVKTLGGIYAGTFGLGIEAAGGLIGGVRRVGGWAANSVGLNPYTDLYVSGSEKPILYAKDQYSGNIVYEDNGEVPKSTKEIIKRGVPLVNIKTETYAVTEEEIRQGLWAKDGVLGTVIKAPFKLAGQFLAMEHTLIKGAVGIATIAAKGLFGTGGDDPVVDVYLKDHIKDGPLVTRRQQLKGQARFANGDRIEKSTDIHEPVYDFSVEPPRMLVSEEDIKTGLVNVRNKPLGTDRGRTGILASAVGAGSSLAKGLFGTGFKILGGGIGLWFGALKMLLGGGAAVGRGLANLGARLFGFYDNTGFGSKAVKRITNRLDTIIELMKAWGYGGGGGRNSTNVGHHNNYYYYYYGGFGGGGPSKKGKWTRYSNGKYDPLIGEVELPEAFKSAGTPPASGSAKSKKKRIPVKDKSGKTRWIDIDWDGDGEPDLTHKETEQDGHINEYSSRSNSAMWSAILAATGVTPALAWAVKRFKKLTGQQAIGDYITGWEKSGGNIWTKAGRERGMAGARAEHARVLEEEAKARKAAEELVQKERLKAAGVTPEDVKLSKKPMPYKDKNGVWREGGRNGRKLGKGAKGEEAARKIAEPIEKAKRKVAGANPTPRSPTPPSAPSGGSKFSKYLRWLGKPFRFLARTAPVINLAFAGEEGQDYRSGAGSSLGVEGDELTDERVEAATLAGMTNSLMLGIPELIGDRHDRIRDFAYMYDTMKDNGKIVFNRTGAMPRLTGYTRGLYNSDDHYWINPFGGSFWGHKGHLVAGFADAAVDILVNAMNIPGALWALGDVTSASRKAREESDAQSKKLASEIRSKCIKVSKIFNDAGVELPEEYYVKTTRYFGSDLYSEEDVEEMSSGSGIVHGDAASVKKSMVGKPKPGSIPLTVAGEVELSMAFKLYLQFSTETKSVPDPRSKSGKGSDYEEWWDNKEHVSKFQEWLRTKFPSKKKNYAAASQRRLGSLIWPKGSNTPYASVTIDPDLKAAISKVKYSDYADEVNWPVRPSGDDLANKLAREFIDGFESVRFFYEVTAGQKILGRNPVTDAWFHGVSNYAPYKGQIPNATTSYTSGFGGAVTRSTMENPRYRKLKDSVYSIIGQYAESIAIQVSDTHKEAVERSKYMAYKSAAELQDASPASGAERIGGAIADKGTASFNAFNLSGIPGLGLDPLGGFNIPDSVTPKAEEPTVKTGASSTNTSTAVNREGPLTLYPRVVKDFVAHVGGAGAAKKMQYSEFMYKLREYAGRNAYKYIGKDTDRTERHINRDHFVHQVGAVGTEEYAKLFGIDPIGNTLHIREGELIDPRTNAPVKLEGEVKRATPDASVITKPNRSNSTPTQEDLDAQASDLENKKTEDVVKSMTKASSEMSKPVAGTVVAQNARIEEKLGRLIEQQETANKMWGNVIGKQGLNVSGMPELVTITAKKPSGTSVTNVTNVNADYPLDEGISSRSQSVA